MNPQDLTSALEAIIYAADEPVTLDQLAKSVEAEKPEVRAALDALVALSQAQDRGVEIRKVAGGWKMYTKPQHHDVVRKFIKSLRPPVRLTMPALETLAVIAYKQPVTGPEINEIRGVNCGGVLKTLLEKRLITTAGRKPVIGRPILYRTSKDFLMRFGLSDLEELPSLKEFEQLAQAALGTDDGIAPIEPEERGVEPQANVAGEAATGEIADAPKAAVVAAGATSSSSTASTPARTDTANSPTTDVAAPESSSPEEIISGADGD
ncbi:MAG: SMC-Scp complex subunit ScpB [Candidatus Acidiferrales bacterium]|jgi:segregation and condensation protein B